MANLACAGARRMPPILCLAISIVSGAGGAQEQRAPRGISLDIDVVAKQLDVARQQIEPRLGATVYDFNRQAIETQPQGDNQS